MTVTDERAGRTACAASHLAKLLNAGYEVQLTQNPEGDDYIADVIHHLIGYSCTAIADTPEGAVWAASPLHGDEEYAPMEAQTAAAIWRDGDEHQGDDVTAARVVLRLVKERLDNIGIDLCDLAASLAGPDGRVRALAAELSAEAAAAGTSAGAA